MVLGLYHTLTGGNVHSSPSQTNRQGMSTIWMIEVSNCSLVNLLRTVQLNTSLISQSFESGLDFNACGLHNPLARQDLSHQYL